MRRRYQRVDTIGDGEPRQLERGGERGRAVVEVGQNVDMKIDH
jgi:hypothetical protein